LGFPVLLTGNIIDLGTRQLNVVAACSGLRYLVNLLIMGVIFCYFFQRRTWKAIILLLSLIPYAILGNALRLATIGIFPVFLDGWWHESLGLSIFLVGFDYLKLINWGLNHLVPKAPESAVEKVTPEPASSAFRSGASLSPYLLAVLGVILLGGYLVHLVPQAIAMPPIQSLENFPMTLGSWQGTRRFIDDEKTLQVLGCDSYIDINYVNSTHRQVSLLIVHYNYLGRGKFLHPPQSCFTGAGGIIEASGVLTPYPDFPLNYMVVKEGGRTFLVYFWFLNRGRWVAKDTTSKLGNLYDALATRRTDGSLVRIITPMGDDSAGAHSRLLFFTEFLKGELPKFIRY
jgi:EpsI family protein